ncbi:MAG: hypothetical protein AAGF19_07455, partial [Pseudomonadota bacterium]
MSNPTNKFVFRADREDEVRESFIFADGDDRHDVIEDFDNISRPDLIHDRVDISKIFEGLGGQFTDGVNDLQDRREAVQFEHGDFDNDGQSDDVRLTIAGKDDFSLTFVDPTNKWDTAFDVGDGTNVHDNVVVMTDGDTPEPAEPLETFNADSQRLQDETFVVGAEQAGRGVVVRDFDNISGDGSASDVLDLSEIFQDLGGKYTDGVNDYQDRKAAIDIETADLDGDGRNDDALLTVDGNDEFSVSFVDVDAPFASGFDIGREGNHTDIYVMGEDEAAAPAPQAPAVAPAPVTAPVVAQPAPVVTPEPAPAAPAPAPQPAPAPSAP